ncbi:twin-arginine translocation signal domain-containing protein [Salmonella enterica subsp. enterica serovar Javiana]|nr:twin-arginine translocation signal domain-containing protein [Salmonella enterica subsp. enterica serovar Javiana]
MSNETGHLNRRSFLKGIVALGAVAALPGGLLTSRCALAQPPVPFNPKRTKFIVTRVRVTAMTPVASRHG